jgi:hypothetical protein
MAVLSRGLLLRFVSPGFEGCAVVSSVGGLWFRCVVDLAPDLAPAFTSRLIRLLDPFTLLAKN